MEKNEAQTVVLQSLKKLQVLEKNFFRKKILLSYLCRYDLQKRCAEIFLNKWVSRYLSSVILRFRKTVLHNEIINKTRSTKKQENSAHRFGDN